MDAASFVISSEDVSGCIEEVEKCLNGIVTKKYVPEDSSLLNPQVYTVISL